MSQLAAASSEAPKPEIPLDETPQAAFSQNSVPSTEGTENSTITDDVCRIRAESSTAPNSEIIGSKENFDRREKMQRLFDNNSKKFPAVTHTSSSEILENYDVFSQKLKTNRGMDKNQTLPENLLLIDCRTEEEQAISMIPKAITANLFTESYMNKESTNSVSSLQSTLLVPYCTIGMRSGKFSKNLLDHGFKNVQNLDGIVLWVHAGGKVVKNIPNQPEEHATVVNNVHVYGSNCDLAPTNYTTFKFGIISKVKSLLS